MKKEELRKKYQAKREKEKNTKEKSEKIMQQIIKQEFYQKAKIIAIYSPIKKEVDTKILLEACLKDQKVVAYPKVKNKKEMEFFKIEKETDLSPGKYQILEPKITKERKIDKDSIEVIIIPGICFDYEKNRIGYGKGYYDLYLKNTKCLKVGIGYQSQITEEKIETNKKDIKMDYIITENKIIDEN